MLLVHGGPWGRDTWGFNPRPVPGQPRLRVLQVNYRGSTGFGKKFLNAGNREWAGKMHNDLIDAVDWAVKREDRRPEQGGDHGRQLRRLRALVGADVHAGQVRLRRGHRRARRTS